MRINQAKRLKELEKENSRFKKLVADQTLDLFYFLLLLYIKYIKVEINVSPKYIYIRKFEYFE